MLKQTHVTRFNHQNYVYINFMSVWKYIHNWFLEKKTTMIIKLAKKSIACLEPQLGRSRIYKLLREREVGPSQSERAVCLFVLEVYICYFTYYSLPAVHTVCKYSLGEQLIN